MPRFPDRTDHEFDPSAEELYKEHIVEHHLKQLKVDKSKGPDDVYLHVLKHYAEAIAIPLTLIYSRPTSNRQTSYQSSRREVR